MEKKNLDWANLGFGYVKTDKRFVANYKDGAWDDGVITDDDINPQLKLYHLNELNTDELDKLQEVIDFFLYRKNQKEG